MASFSEAPSGDSGKGAKIFKTKCAQCHVAEKGGGHKQARLMALSLHLYCIVCLSGCVSNRVKFGAGPIIE